MVGISLPGLQKIGTLMDIIMKYLLHVQFIESMDNVKLFAELALMGTDFARSLRPVLHRWKQHTKHDRALIRQVKEINYWCGFEDMWILEFALHLRRRDVLILRKCTNYPLGWMTTISKYDPAIMDWIMEFPLGTKVWRFGLTITSWLTSNDKYSLACLCWIGNHILQEKDVQSSVLLLPFLVGDDGTTASREQMYSEDSDDGTSTTSDYD